MPAALRAAELKAKPFTHYKKDIGVSNSLVYIRYMQNKWDNAAHRIRATYMP